MTSAGGATAARPALQALASGRLRFLLAVVAGVGSAGAVRWVLQTEPTIATDVVGYPIWAPFDVHYYFENYVLAVIVFPFVTLVAFHLLTMLGRRAGSVAPPPATPLLPLRRTTTPVGRRVSVPAAALAGKVALVGALWAAGIAIALGSGRWWALTILPAGVVGYGAAVVAAGRQVTRRRRATPLQGMAAVNAVGGAASSVVLLLASTSTRVIVDSTGRVDGNELAHPLLLIVVPVAVVALVVAGLVRSGRDRWAALERRVLLYVTAPILIFISTSRMVGAAGTVDLFHEGEALGASRLIADGAFPWRDVLFIHGLLADVALKWLGVSALGDTRWALVASDRLLVYPLCWLASYLLFVRLFRSKPVFLLGSQLLILMGFITPVMTHFRFILVPISLLLLGRVLDRGTWGRAVALTWLAGVQLVIAPDTSFVSIAVLVTVVAFDAAHHVPGARLGVSLQRTIRCVVAGVAFLAGLLGFLVANRALDDFVFYYRIFSVDHELSGGIPITWVDDGFRFWAIAPVAVILVATWWAIARIRARAAFTTDDWVVAAAILGLVPFYTKFISRGDGHVYQVAALAIVPLLYVAYRSLDWAQRRLRHRHLREALPVLLLALLALVAPRQLTDAIAAVPGNRESHVPIEPELASLGYQVRGTGDAALIEEVRRILDEHLPAGETMFDFTNSPALFSYFLDAPVATRYFHVSMAVPEIAQQDLVDELAEERPAVVAYSSVEHGLPKWDGIVNHVRHYLVSAYLLDEYVPVADTHDYVFLKRRDLVHGPADTSRYLDAEPCDWRYALESLTYEPGDDLRWTEAEVREIDAPVLVKGWAVSTSPIAVPEEILVAHRGVVVDRVPVGLRRTDVAFELEEAAATRSGFEAYLVDLPPALPPGELRFFVHTEDDRVVQLARGYEPNEDVSSLRDEDGDLLAVEEGGVRGNLEQADRITGIAMEVTLPAGAVAADWVRVEASGPIRGRLVLTGGVGPSGDISVRALPGHGASYDIAVGSCPQWFGYSGRALLVPDPGVQVTAVRLGLG